MLSKISIPLVAIVVIGALEAFALSKGINGVALTASIATISGIGGYKVKDLMQGKLSGKAPAKKVRR